MRKFKLRKQNIGPLILNNYGFLKKVARTRSNKKRRKLLNNITENELLAIVDIASNILNSNFKLKNYQKLKLVPFADIIRKLARKRSFSGTKKLINQTGEGALGFLIPLLAPVLTEAAHHLLSKITKQDGN